MKNFFATALAAAMMLTSSCGVCPTALRTDLMEHTDVDYGGGRRALIRSSKPQLCWQVPSIGDSTVQSGYRIVLKGDGGLLWDSGWTDGSSSVAAEYAGEALEAGREYSWAVQLRLKSASGREVTTRLSDYKRFKTDSALCDYSTAAYPIVAQLQQCGAAQGGVYDFKKDAFGKLRLTLDSPKADTVKVIIGERLKEGRIEQPPRISSVVYDEILLPVEAGRRTYTVEAGRNARNTGPSAVPLPDYVGVVAPFRYCTIEGEATPVKVERLSYSYPFDEGAASFECSNDTLNAIWDLCRYSVKACSFAGIWVDGNRERIPYEYDALISQLCHYGSDAEYSLDRRTLEWLLEKPTWPTEWILYAVEIAWNDYLWTGDKRALEQNYDLLKARAMNPLRSGALLTTTRGQSGEFLSSINRTEPLKDIVDWPHSSILGLAQGEGGEDDKFEYTDFNAVVNALYYRTLVRLKDIAFALGKEGESRQFAAQADETRSAYMETFFDADKGIFRDGPGSAHSALHSNMTPLVCGLVPQENIGTVADFVVSRGLRCSIFGAHNLLQALYAARRGDEALSLMSATGIRSWYNGLRMGSTITLEAWDDSFKPNQDWNHIAGAAPGNAIPFGLMGVTPLEPGFARVRIAPQIGSLQWAKATVPTIRGAVKVAVDKESIEVSIPANMVAEVHLGGGRTATVGSGTHRFALEPR